MLITPSTSFSPRPREEEEGGLLMGLQVSDSGSHLSLNY